MNMWKILTYLTLFVVINAEDANLYRTVETKNGLIRGIKLKTLLKSREYFAFKGIPYAEKPIGELRFKPPKPIASWKPDTLDALEYEKICYQQMHFFALTAPESEDCLFLNVFVPANADNGKLAVMFFIHGGGYGEGSGEGSFYGPDFLVEQNVILVTVNYRLAAFGFMSLDTPEYSGNMGLKDQQLALKWVHTNIDRFGGDNKRITVFGHSAGGASTHFHMLSSESRKYFRNAIPMSGTVEDFWAVNNEDDHLDYMFDIAKKAGKPKQTYEELVDFLKSVPAEKIVDFSPEHTIDARLKFHWAPIIERSDAIEPFITEEVEDVYKMSNTDMNSMFGFTSRESIFMAPVVNTTGEEVSKNFASYSHLLHPFRNLNLLDDSDVRIPIAESDEIANEIEDFYFKDVEDADEAYLDLMSDINFAYSAYKAAKIQAKISNGQTFLYRFSVESKLNAIRETSAVTASGASHADEICYLFRCAVAQPLYDNVLSNRGSEESKTSLKAIENITKLFTNFAKYGTPTHNNEPIDEIKPIQGNHVHFVDITNNGLIAGLDPNQKVNEFWERIDEKARKLSLTQNIDRDEL